MMYKVANDLPVPKRIARTHVKAKRDYLKRCEMGFDKRMQHIINIVDTAKEGHFSSSKRTKKTTKRQP